MANTHYNSFLPSGGAEFRPRDPSSRSSSAISPMTQPRRFPTTDFMSPPRIGSPHAVQVRPISPPQSRSPSAENAPAAMLEDWRSYTANLRSQFKGERAHLAADRARMEECMDEERGLWELERGYFVAQVAELEAKLEKMRLRAESAERRTQGPTSQPLSSCSSSSGIPRTSAFMTRSMSGSSHESISSHSVPQESGRDANGAIFYAPAPRNPTRTFDKGASNLRLDSISSGSESALQVASKELKPSDFKQSSPGSETLSPVPESFSNGIDISFIQPGLEGVSIRASAVHPTFAAKILSPIQSPNQAPSRPEPLSLDETSSRRSSPPRKPTSPEGREIKTLEVVSAPENRRLTMNAGHTPNHSITKLPWLNEADGDATPKQQIIYKGAIDRRASMALSLASVPDDDADDEDEDGDVELMGQLGLVGNADLDNPFLAALTEKLVEVQKSQPTSPGGSSTTSTSTIGREREQKDEEEEEDAMPRLRLKSTSNFGRPMGSM